MEIYLMRHAEAVSAGEWRKSDADRPLSKRGIANLEEGLKEMKRVGFSVPVIVSSSYLRAKDTALAVSKALSLPQPLILDELGSGAHHNTLKKIVLEYSQTSPVLLVGHMPELAVFGSRITFEASLLDGGLEPADILALETGELDKDWGLGKIIWWRKINDWKGLVR